MATPSTLGSQEKASRSGRARAPAAEAFGPGGAGRPRGRGVVEAHHGDPVGHLGEQAERGPAHRLGRASPGGTSAGWSASSSRSPETRGRSRRRGSPACRGSGPLVVVPDQSPQFGRPAPPRTRRPRSAGDPGAQHGVRLGGVEEGDGARRHRARRLSKCTAAPARCARRRGRRAAGRGLTWATRGRRRRAAGRPRSASTDRGSPTPRPCAPRRPPGTWYRRNWNQ